ncbi:proton-conducting transporter membrane subunit [Angustibacter sp. Root456]|uniref:proton-conducting transporter transmembrane domain-containing protein n=1 Tax=Angustibacter sp. Root456 TaxID=1736539 RepID=UPI0006FD4ADD|nr:proton-conducting transporter membrane subunit [Angustibacter sp. Root456]KQX64512.1 NADH dehydrogenase [Angustibacter sp. Root456]
MTAALWALVLLPLVVGGLLCLVGPRADRVASTVSTVCAAAVLALAIVTATSHPRVAAPFLAGSSFGLAVDGLAAVLLVTVAAVALLVLVFASVDVGSARWRFHGLMLLFEGAVLVTVTATTLPTLLAAWEVMGATSYALIGFWWQEPRRLASGAVAFLTTRTADLGLYAAAGAALAGGHGLALADLASAPPGWRDVIAVGVLVAALGKAAQLPFSFWLSRAMDGPSPVSALLHSAAMVAMGGYLLLRLEPLLAATPWVADVAAWLGAATALLMGVVAVTQRDLKQLLAASTASQLGFVVAGAGVGAVAGGTAQLVAHAATKAALFLAAGAWLTALGTRHLVGLRGVARRWRTLGVAASVALLSLAGLPPLALWATKDDVLAVARHRSVPLFGLLLLAAVVSAAYAGKALVQVWRAPLSTTADAWDDEHAGTRHVGGLERLPVMVLAAGAAVLELLVLPPFGDRLRGVLGRPDEPSASAAEMAVTGLLATAVLGLTVVVARRPAWLDRLPQPDWAVGWLRLERAADAVVAQPTAALAQRLSSFDDAVVDGAVRGAVRLATAGARAAGRWDEGALDAAVERLASAVRGAGRLARRPQTGQLHQYYLQAVAVLTVAVVLLIVVR